MVIVAVQAWPSGVVGQAPLRQLPATPASGPPTTAGSGRPTHGSGSRRLPCNTRAASPIWPPNAAPAADRVGRTTAVAPSTEVKIRYWPAGATLPESSTSTMVWNPPDGLSVKAPVVRLAFISAANSSPSVIGA